MGGWGFFGNITVSPLLGNVGDTLTITNTGSGFFGNMIITIDGISADDITVVDHQTITCKIPEGVIAKATVYIENPDGENITLVDIFSLISLAKYSFWFNRRSWRF